MFGVCVWRGIGNAGSICMARKNKTLNLFHEMKPTEIAWTKRSPLPPAALIRPIILCDLSDGPFSFGFHWKYVIISRLFIYNISDQVSSPKTIWKLEMRKKRSSSKSFASFCFFSPILMMADFYCSVQQKCEQFKWFFGHIKVDAVFFVAIFNARFALYSVLVWDLRSMVQQSISSSQQVTFHRNKDANFILKPAKLYVFNVDIVADAIIIRCSQRNMEK